MSTPPVALDTDTAQHSPAQRSAYRIACGPWILAFELHWTTGISDSFVLNPIPRAPAWLAGCTNVEGLVIPVVDLSLLLDPQAPTQTTAATEKTRLLLGGYSGADNEEAIGVLFTGLPQYITYTPEALPDEIPLPAPVKALARGFARANAGPPALEVDADALIDLCIRQLDAAEALLPHA